MNRYRRSLADQNNEIHGNISPIKRPDEHNSSHETLTSCSRSPPPPPARCGSILSPGNQSGCDKVINSPIIEEREVNIPPYPGDENVVYAERIAVIPPPPPMPQLPDYLANSCYRQAPLVDNECLDPNDGLQIDIEGQGSAEMNNQPLNEAINNRQDNISHGSTSYNSFPGFTSPGPAPTELSSALARDSSLREKRLTISTPSTDNQQPLINRAVLSNITNTSSPQSLNNVSVNSSRLVPTGFNENNPFMVTALRRGQGPYASYSEVCLIIT